MRKRSGMSGAELARRVGVTPGAITQWESGLFSPSTDKLPTIAAVLECEVGELYDADELRAASEAAVKRMKEAAQRAAQKMAEQTG